MTRPDRPLTWQEADRTLRAWYERGYVYVNELDTKSTRLVRVEETESRERGGED